MQSAKMEKLHSNQELGDSESKFVNSQDSVGEKGTGANYTEELTRTLEEMVASYHQKVANLQSENLQLKRELSKCEAKQSKLYYHLEQQLDNWLNEKASLESCVDDMEDQLLLSVGAIQGVLSSDYSSLPAESESFKERHGAVQGSQGLVQTLLELGEVFLASKIDEESFRELQTKLFAAKTRDNNIIRQLQHRIGELSEMGTMVTQLKHELIKEKEKAKEEAEDLTQEMAELRYQLMEMLEHERELRAYVEQASLRRIAELEEQLKQTRQDTKAALGCRQAAEVQAEVRGQEIRHLKSVLEEMKQKCASLGTQKQEMEEELLTQLQELQAKNSSLEGVLLKTKQESLQLIPLEEKLVQPDKDYASFNEESELKLLSLEQEKILLLNGMKEMRYLLVDFKHQIVLLAEEHQRSEDKQQQMNGLHDLSLEESEKKTYLTFGGTSKSSKELLTEEKFPVYAGEERDSGEIEDATDLLEEVKELHVEFSPFHSGYQNLEETSSFYVVEGEAAEKSLYIMDNVVNTSSNIEELLGRVSPRETSTGSLYKENEQLQYDLHAYRTLRDNLELQVTKISAEHDIALHTLQQGHDVFIPSFDTPDKKQEWPWTVQEMVEIVESVTEELTKLLRVVLKSLLSTKHSFLSSLELRLQSWSNIPQKALPGKVARSGAIREWGELVVDLVRQSRRELLAMQHKLKDFEIEIEVNENIRAEHAGLNKEATCLKEELTRLEDRHTCEITRKEEERYVAERKLEQGQLALVETQKKVTEQEEMLVSLHGKVRKFELEAERSNSVWASERQLLEAAIREQHGNVQKEKTKRFEEVDKLEKRVEELLKRLEKNEEELDELMDIGCINVDSTIAAKLRWMEENLTDSQNVQASLQAERAELASQVVRLHAKLEEAQQELQVGNEQHVEVLIRYEEERALMEAELEAVKHDLRILEAENEQSSAEKTTNVQLNQMGFANDVPELIEGQDSSQGLLKLHDLLVSKEAELQSQKKLQIETEQKYIELHRSFEEALCKLSLINIELESSKNEAEQLQKAFQSTQNNWSRSLDEEQDLKGSIQTLKEKLWEQDQLLDQWKREIESLEQANDELTKHATGFKSEALAVRQQLVVHESQVNEMNTIIVNLEEALILENLKMNQVEEDYNLQVERLTRREEDYFQLKVKFNDLLNTLASLQTNLGEARKREREAQDHVKKLGLELSVAKEEVGKTEVRVQRILKQAQDQLDAERRQIDVAINARKQTEWFLTKQLEQLESTQIEKAELLTTTEKLKKRLEQTEKERDDLKVAYAELENQFAKRRPLFGK